MLSHHTNIDCDPGIKGQLCLTPNAEIVPDHLLRMQHIKVAEKMLGFQGQHLSPLWENAVGKLHFCPCGSLGRSFPPKCPPSLNRS